MKKQFIMGLLLLLIFVVGCTKSSKQPDHLSTTESSFSTTSIGEHLEPILNGIEDIVVNAGDSFNPLLGITAKDKFDNDITKDIVIEGLEQLRLVDNKITAIGNFVLRYVVADQYGIKQQKYRLVSSLFTYLDGELIANGDFNLNTVGWDGENVSMSVNDGVLSLNMTNTSGHKLLQSGIKFEKNQIYEVNFNAKASKAKVINIQVGEMTVKNEFKDLKPGFNVDFNLTDSLESFTFRFKAADSTTNGVLIFDLGDNSAISIKNISIKKSTVGKDTIPPVIAGANDVTIPVGALLDPFKGVTATDNIDGNLTSTISITLPSGYTLQDGKVLFNKLGDYQIIYQVSDSDGNETKFTRTITVVEVETQYENIIKNGDFSEGTKGWSLSTHEGGTAEWLVDEDGALKIIMSGVNYNNNQSSPRLANELERITLYAGKTYVVKFDGKALQEKQVALQVGEILDSAPWFNDIMRRMEIKTLKTQWQTFEYEFTVTSSTNINACITFELGVINGIGAITTVWLDNISVVEKR